MRKYYVKKGYGKCGANPNSRHLGVMHPRAKLTVAKVRAIRRRAGEPQARLAREFGVTVPTISKVISRDIWAHVSEKSEGAL